MILTQDNNGSAQYRILLEQFILHLLKDEILIGEGRDNDGLHSVITNDIYAHNDYQLLLKCYGNERFIFKYEYLEEDGTPQSQVYNLTNNDCLSIPTNLKNQMKVRLAEFVIEFNGNR